MTPCRHVILCPTLAEATAYNRVVRKALLLAAIFCLAGCNRGNQNKELVRQGVIDHLAKAGLTTANMDIEITDLKFSGNQADTVVAITPKGAPPSQGMKMRYGLQQQGNRWVVTSRGDASGHGTVAPGSANPHGGGMPPGPQGGATPGTGSGGMPSPEDLPPARKK